MSDHRQIKVGSLIFMVVIWLAGVLTAFFGFDLLAGPSGPRFLEGVLITGMIGALGLGFVLNELGLMGRRP